MLSSSCAALVEPMIVRGDARSLPLPDESVDLIVTSPPYFGLRSYTDGGAHYDGQIGDEPTPAEYIEALVECTREWMRVLKPSGSIFVNLGDKYAQNKSLRLLPERYRIACTDELGLIARAVLVWSKPNGLPESVTDRVRRSHEDWVHLTKSPKYFTSIDEIREPHVWNRKINPEWNEARGDRSVSTVGRTTEQQSFRSVNPLGKLPGSVWEIATQPLSVPAELGVDHFAAFPMEWPRRLVLGWSPREVCTACGEGRRPVVERSESSWQRRRADGDPVRYGLVPSSGLNRSLSDPEDRAAGGFGKPAERRITGYACSCPDTSAPSTPGVVLDPFGGTGTTALVAGMLGRRGVSVDMSADYCRLARWRVADPQQRERAGRPAGSQPARQVVKAAQHPMTEPLFDVG